LFLFTEAILKGEPINIFNHGKMIRDFTYVTDIVQGVKRVIEKVPEVNNDWIESDGPSNSTAPYKIYNIGNNNPINLMDFIEEIEKQLDIKAIRNYLGMQDGDVPITQADVQDLERDIKYKPEIAIQTGIKNFLEWYLKFYGNE